MSKPRDRRQPERPDDAPSDEDEEEGLDDVDLWEQLRRNLHELEDLEDAESDDEAEGEGEGIPADGEPGEEDDPRLPAERALDEDADEDPPEPEPGPSDPLPAPAPPRPAWEEDPGENPTAPEDLWLPLGEGETADLPDPLDVPSDADGPLWDPADGEDGPDLVLPAPPVPAPDELWGPISPGGELVATPAPLLARAIRVPAQGLAEARASGAQRVLPWRCRADLRLPPLGAVEVLADPQRGGSVLEVPGWSWEGTGRLLVRGGEAQGSVDALPGDGPACIVGLRLLGQDHLVRVVLANGPVPVLRLGRDLLEGRFVVSARESGDAGDEE